MRESRPLIVTFIGDISVLSAFLWILPLFTSLTDRYGIYMESLSVFSEAIIRLLMSIILLIISYGYLRLKRWGYWLMMTKSLFFLVISIIVAQQSGQQSSYIGIITIVINIMFVLPTREYFGKKILST